MINVTPINSAGHAANYLTGDGHSREHGDYYARGEVAPAVWHGKGARALGLHGQVVTTEALSRVLDGQVGGQTLGTVRDGGRVRRAGWDVTISAPKSVSIAAIVGGDERLIAAHDAAVEAVISHLERLAATRVRTPDGVQLEHTGNLLIATVRHETNRTQGDPEPDLHTHLAVANATRLQDAWRSLETRGIFIAQRELDDVYKSVLAHDARKLGYELERTKNGFEIAGIDDTMRGEFSSRSRDVDAWLASKGLTRDTATPAQLRAAGKATRGAKQHLDEVDRTALRDRWEQRAAEHGDLSQTITEARARASDAHYQRRLNQHIRAAAERALKDGSDHHAEREMRMTRGDLMATSRRLAVHHGVTDADLSQAIEDARTRGALVDREVSTWDRGEGRTVTSEGYTTEAGIKLETDMLAHARAMRGAAAPLCTTERAQSALTAAERESARHGHAWNDDQRAAALGVLTSRDQLTTIQGLAGTAKTTTVLRVASDELHAQGYEVIGMAPGGSQAQTLKDAAIEQTSTVAAHLGKARAMASGEASNQVWVVDEVGQLSARDLRDLLRVARHTGARVITTGDVYQRGSVEAGRAFAQIQQEAAPHEMRHILRQKNEHLREAVYDTLRGDHDGALDRLSRGAGSLTQQSVAGERYKQISEDYLAQPAPERDKSIVVTMTRAARDEITQHVRSALREAGELGVSDLSTTTLEQRDLTRTSARDAGNYREGDVVRFDRDYTSRGVERGSHWQVDAVDAGINTVHLRSDSGETLAWQPHRWGAGHVKCYEERSTGVAVGDRLIYTKNDHARGVLNGQEVRVTSIDAQHNTITVQRQDGTRETLDTRERMGQHLRHAYAYTVDGAQGKTGSRVFADLDSRQQGLNAQALYVALSRGQHSAHVYTDDIKQLRHVVRERSGQKSVALEQAPRMPDVPRDLSHDSPSTPHVALPTTPKDRDVSHSANGRITRDHAHPARDTAHSNRTDRERDAKLVREANTAQQERNRDRGRGRELER